MTEHLPAPEHLVNPPDHSRGEQHHDVIEPIAPPPLLHADGGDGVASWSFKSDWSVLSLTGARGGSGVTTSAIVLAVRSRAVWLVGDVADLRYQSGVDGNHVNDTLTISDTLPAPAAGHRVVIDAGSLNHPFDHDASQVDLAVLVIRGPSYEAVTTTVHSGRRFDGIVLVREPGRGLRGQDVTTALSIPILVEVTVDPAVARAVDAGLLPQRLPRTLDRLAVLEPHDLARPGNPDPSDS